VQKVKELENPKEDFSRGESHIRPVFPHSFMETIKRRDLQVYGVETKRKYVKCGVAEAW